MSLWTRLKDFGPWSRARRERDLEQEIRNHLELEAEEAGADGARRAFGSVTLVKEDVRAAWGWARVEQFAGDVRYGLRQVRRNPAFSAIAIATLALGIGVNAAMFSAVDAVLIRPLPYAAADRLVMIWDEMSYIGFPKHASTPPEWHEWRRLNTMFTDVAAMQPTSATLSGDGEPEQIRGSKVTGNFWPVLGVRPLIGRVFTEDEDTRGVKAAVISHGLWQRRFGGSPDAIGQTIVLNDIPHEVLGVMPRDFYFLPGPDADVWMPISFSPQLLQQYAFHALRIVARMKPGVTLEEARASMDALSLRVTANLRPPRSAVVTPLREELAGKTQTALIVLLSASAVVLLIACVNLANLLLSRGAVRRREVAVRAALGAGRGRLIAQFLIESLVLAGLGAVAGLIVALPVMRFLETLVPETMPAVRLTLDWRVLIFSAAIAVGAGLTFGLAPALGGWRRALALQDGLRDGGRGSAGARSHWFQQSLIVVETALAVVLLTSGGLLLQTFQQLRQRDLGIRAEQILTLETPLFRYRAFDKRVAFVDAQLEKVRAIPGVIAASAISRIPLTETGQTTRYVFPGQPGEDTRSQDALSRVVTREYFATVGASLREGRFFDASDRKSAAPVAIVNESFANRNFPGRSALGAQFKFGVLGARGYLYTIVGVVKEIRERGVAEELKPAVYRVHEQGDQADEPSGIVVRTSIDPLSIVPAVRQAIWSVDKNQPITRVRTLDDIVARQLSAPSQNTALLSAFALLALMLASLGLYGVLSHAVTQRTNEIGVRMALGATSSNILLTFSRRGLALTLTGLAVGLVLSIVAARLMTTLFYGFTPEYLPAATIVSLILLGVAALACMIPARRASRIDPTIALQHE